MNVPDAGPTIGVTIDEDSAGLRIDVFLASLKEIPSRASARRLIDEGMVTVNGVPPAKAGHRLSAGDKVRVTLPEAEPLDLVGEAIPLDILYEDEDLLVINKPKDLVVHPAPGHWEGTLVHALIHYLPRLPKIGGALRPGIVHRLDKDTTGALVVAKTEAAHRRLSADLKDRKVKREYLALVHGVVRPDKGVIDAAIGRHPVHRKRMDVVPGKGRRAVTHFSVLERFARYSYLELSLETGRTHQIRVHLAHIGHPVVGDPVYGPKKPHFVPDGQVLHAAAVTLCHPRTGEPLTVRAPLPAGFMDALGRARLDAAGSGRVR